LRHYRIDGAHSNAYTEWERQHKPIYPTSVQQSAIKAHEGLELLEPPRTVALNAGEIRLNFRLPVHSVSLLVFLPIKSES
ncbi:MAG: glycoside hydrolase, partial [Anaerolineae bacterium]|nr:glycoside hydrolase [Anaerolineae bacterium]